MLFAKLFSGFAIRNMNDSLDLGFFFLFMSKCTMHRQNRIIANAIEASGVLCIAMDPVATPLSMKAERSGQRWNENGAF